MDQPTAEVEPSAAVAAPNRSFSPAPLLGELTSDRLDGAPVATSVVYGDVLFSRSPTRVRAESEPVTPSVVRLSAASAGEGSEDQLVPFQCSTRAVLGKAVPVCPTVYTLLADTARMAYRALPRPFGSAAGTTDQLVPFQCSISGWNTPLLSCCAPAAQTSLSDIAATP